MKSDDNKPEQIDLNDLARGLLSPALNNALSEIDVKKQDATGVTLRFELKAKGRSAALLILLVFFLLSNGHQALEALRRLVQH